MTIIDRLIDAARRRNGSVVFPEAADPRILQAARRIIDDRIATPVLVGEQAAVEAAACSAGIALDGITVLDPAATAEARLDDFARLYQAGRPGTRDGVARRLMRKPLYFGAMLVKSGDADAIVAGVANPTARVIEAGLMTVGMAAGIETPSSFFLMILPSFRGEADKPLIFADCAVNIDPDPGALADIAIASAASAARLLDEAPRVALLSFSTRGSARHPLVDKVTEALAIARARAPELAIDGEFQADSALVEAVAAAKMKEPGTVAGRANVLIFPDLNAGNIAYKLTQYLAGATAVGPILQGFARPVCDLSRGASVDDVVATSAIALAQS